MTSMTINPVGIIHTPFTEPERMPIQPTGARDVIGEIEVLPEFVEGLRDLEGFSHIHVLYYFHRNSGYSLQVIPFMDTVPRGVFATRAPRRPNMIGLSVVQLLSVQGNILRVQGIDVLDGTPLLDIKPYVAKFDAPPADRFGWLEVNAAKAESLKSDARFVAGSDTDEL